MKYIGTLQAAMESRLSQDRIRVLCVKGLIPDATKYGKTWLIPKNFTITRTGTRGPKSSITGPTQLSGPRNPKGMGP